MRAHASGNATSDQILNRLRGCAEIADSGERLTCYDKAMPPNISIAGELTMRRQRAPLSGSGAPYRASIDSDTYPERERPSFRFDVGYEFGIGNQAGSFRIFKGSLEADSVTGGSGSGILADIWLDHWPANNLSVGLEYLELYNQGSLTGRFPKGLSILTDPVYVRVGVSAKARFGFLNLAYRPNSLGWIRPVVGGGIGLGYGSAAISSVVSNDFIGTYGNFSRAGSQIAGLQGFAGVDVNLTNRLYFSLLPRVVWVTAHPIGKNQRYTDFILGTTLGYSFK